MKKQIIVTASIFGLIAVIAGAFGAHGLKALISDTQLSIWHTAVEYQFYHVFALLFLSTFTDTNKYLKASYYLFVFGMIFFSGSLYLLACRDLLNIATATNIIGPITPVGGLLFMAGWVTLALAAMRGK